MENLDATILESIDNLNSSEKFTRIALAGGFIAYLSLTQIKKGLICSTNNIQTIILLDFIAATLGILVTVYFFNENLKFYNPDETNCIIKNSQNLSIITSGILVVIEIFRFVDLLKTSNYEYCEYLKGLKVDETTQISTTENLAIPSVL